jgi:hypothetical protein
MGDETCIDHFEDKFKQQLMDLHHTTPRKKTFKSKLAEGKSWLQSLGIKKDVIFVNFLPRATAVNSDHCNETLKSLNANLC